MATNVIISIEESSGKTVFNPSTQTAGLGDLIYWRNNTSQAHKLVLKSNPSVAWVPEIPGKLPDQPAPVSQRAVTFSAKTATTGVEYMCSTHGEIGTLIIK
jgi:plastocyanin